MKVKVVEAKTNAVHCPSITDSDQFSTLRSIIHGQCGPTGTLFISWLDLVFISGPTKASRSRP